MRGERMRILVKGGTIIDGTGGPTREGRHGQRPPARGGHGGRGDRGHDVRESPPPPAHEHRLGRVPAPRRKAHPRTFGTFPRVLERYVRGLGLFSLEEALHDRGTLAVGAAADLVLFEPAGVKNRATYADPKRS